jgi:hypothetical protein
MERVFRLSDFPIFPLNPLCPIVMYLKMVLSYSTNLIYVYPTSMLCWYGAIFKRGPGKQTDCDSPSVACRLESCTGFVLCDCARSMPAMCCLNGLFALKIQNNLPCVCARTIDYLCVPFVLPCIYIVDSTHA